MLRATLTLLIMCLVAFGTLHAPALAHDPESGLVHHDHATADDHGSQAAVQTADEEQSDSERGMVAPAHDHAPAGLLMGDAQSALPSPMSGTPYRLRQHSALVAWATAPPVEPPAA